MWCDDPNGKAGTITDDCAKVVPITRIDARELAPGPVYAEARALSWAFAETQRRPASVVSSAA